MKGKTIFFFCILLIVSICAKAQPRTDSILSAILKAANQRVIDSVIAHPMNYRCQVIYTQINRDNDNHPHFTNYYFNHDPGLYFNPASMVKLPLALLTLEKLHSIPSKKVNMYTTVYFDSSFTRQVRLYTDSTSENGLPSLAHFIKKAFLISDNDAYNRLYQFVGQQQINRRLQGKGYKDTRIIRQFMGYTEEQNRHTNPVRFLDPRGKTIYTQPSGFNTDSFYFPEKPITIGKAYYNRNDSLVHEPMDFTRQNNIPLHDLQQMLQSVIFPGSVQAYQQFNLTGDDRKFLLKYLSQYPSETDYPKYDTGKFYDSYVKFFFRDSTYKMPEGIRVFNKTGWAYGFLTDVSYVADFKNKVEFMLSATIYVNSDGILNDNKYDYNTVGYPFLYHLGQAIYQFEKKRARVLPDLKEVKVKYDKRKPDDRRPSIKEADN